jgi:16S rRNA C967 or C1407 C5-methylase (RsmB/RsmF family)
MPSGRSPRKPAPFGRDRRDRLQRHHRRAAHRRRRAPARAGPGAQPAPPGAARRRAGYPGRAYEYLLRKFAEGQGQSAGEFYTPRMVGVLMAHLLDPEPGMTVYDPACGSGGLLIKCHLRL